MPETPAVRRPRGSPRTSLPASLPSRVVISRVSPALQEGRGAVRRIAGDIVRVRAHVFADGHDQLGALLLFRRIGISKWSTALMDFEAPDVAVATFAVPQAGSYEFTVEAWVDRFSSWLAAAEKRVVAGDDLVSEAAAGAVLLLAATQAAPAAVAETLQRAAALLQAARGQDALDIARNARAMVLRWQDREPRAMLGRMERIEVDPPLAAFGAWYEFFPRSTGADGSHGTFRDALPMLTYVASMGFDVVYLPPIHPIGTTNRKGANNSLTAAPDEPGSPWAIGSAAGGHDAVHPELGTLDDFRAFVTAADELGLSIALDLAFQCSPDHPWITEHPNWFSHLPDGTIRHAENPPKKYEDIVPFDFECDDWRGLWVGLRGVVAHWIEQGVHIFRVDNPHTKSLAFWEWLIADIRREHPDVFFLAEAFTRPDLLHHLARTGFSQSYTYFTWRNTRDELTEYLRELTSGPAAEYLRPSLWPNTPDILPAELQAGGRPAFIARLMLAATLSSTYGVYGPAFELLDATPLADGLEEYRDSEKFQLKTWTLDHPWSLRDMITAVNAIRREHVALHSNATLIFHPTDNRQVIAYSKHTVEPRDVIIVVVNLDPHHRQACTVALDMEWLPVDFSRPVQAHDLLGDGRYLWSEPRVYVELDPAQSPAQIFTMRAWVRSEHDFDYYL